MLNLSEVTVRFGGVQALSEIDFSVEKGLISAVIGPNGAGKTTLFNVITGMVRPTSGRIDFRGREITGSPNHVRAGLGIARTFQNLEIFTNMTVLENVMTGCHRNVRYSAWDSILKTPKFFKEEKRIRDYALSRLDFVGLADKALMPAKELPFGNQRLLEIARALAADPEIILLDEPAAGLNIKETGELGELIRRIKDLGVTVVLVEHDMDLVMNISEVITVFSFGRTLCSGTPSEVRANPEVIAAYLGE